jgi:hypothetical protein
MSDSPATAPRPVALITTISVLALSAIAWVVVANFYDPAAASPQNAPAENLPKELAWKATPATRQKALSDLREQQSKQASSYAWVDQKAGVIQLPVERAMQLTADKYGSKK